MSAQNINMEYKAGLVICVCSQKPLCMPQVNHPHTDCHFIRHEHTYFLLSTSLLPIIYESTSYYLLVYLWYLIKDKKQLNNTKKKIIKFISHYCFPHSETKSLQNNSKTKNFLVRHKTKTTTGMFQALLGWETFKKLCSKNMCKSNASITH